MARKLTDDTNYKNIADAIRDRGGTMNAFLPSEMPEAVRAIPGGGGMDVEVDNGALVFTEGETPTPTITGVTGVKGDQESSYHDGYVNITPANIGAVPVGDAVTGVKGDQESSYRRGSVNITPANIGAAVVIRVDIPSFSTLPRTVADSRITSDMQVISATLSNPDAQTGIWEVETASGSLTVRRYDDDAAITGATGMTLYLSTIQGDRQVSTIEPKNIAVVEIVDIPSFTVNAGGAYSLTLTHSKPGYVCWFLNYFEYRSNNTWFTHVKSLSNGNAVLDICNTGSAAMSVSSAKAVWLCIHE